MVIVCVSLALAGCVLDGFHFGPEYRADDTGAVKPVPNLRTYRVGTSTQKDLQIFVRFVLIDANQYAMEQFVQDGKEAVFQVLQATFVPLEDGWYMLSWRNAPKAVFHGVHLVRFERDHMAVAEVSKLETVIIERLAPAAGLKASASTRFGSTGLGLDPKNPAQLPVFLKSVLRAPGLTVQRFQAVDAVPRDLRDSAMQENAKDFAKIGLQDVRNPAQATRMLNYFRVLHSEGVGLGSYAYARFAINGWGMPRDTRLARELALKATSQGVARANSVLGFLASQGIDQPQDLARAVQYFELAAKAGDGLAYTNLGFAYLQGLGVTKDVGRAAEWFERGVGEDILEARVQLAELVIKGQGVAKNDARALKLLEPAVEAAHPAGLALRAFLHASGRGGPVDQSKASALFLQSAQLGNPYAQWQIGERLVGGVGIAADRASGMQWLQKAATGGIAEAGEAMKKHAAVPAPVPGKKPDPELAATEASIDQFIDRETKRLNEEAAASQRKIGNLDKEKDRLNLERGELNREMHENLLAQRKNALSQARNKLLTLLRAQEKNLLHGNTLVDKALALGGSAQEREDWKSARRKASTDLQQVRSKIADLEGAHPDVLGWRLPNGQIVLTRPDGKQFAIKVDRAESIDTAVLPRKGDQSVSGVSALALVQYEQSWVDVPSDNSRVKKLIDTLNELIGKFSCTGRSLAGVKLAFRNTQLAGGPLLVDVNGVLRARQQMGDISIDRWWETEAFVPLGRIGEVELWRQPSGQCSTVIARCSDAARVCVVQTDNKPEVSTSVAVSLHFADETRAARAADAIRELVKIVQ
jgi:TPR repeat protein